MIKISLLAALLAFSAPAAPEQLTLQINPTIAYDKYLGRPAEITYTIRISSPKDKIICSGWLYPIYNLRQDEWPYRRSCKEAEFKLSIEKWGGKYPLPYVGNYIAFAELIDSNSHLTASAKFQILAGVDR